MDQLASLAGTDPALAAQLIKLANSGLYARGSKPLTNLRTAVLRLGSQMVRNISIALAAQQVFLGYGSASIHPNLRRTWRHSLHTAALSHLMLSIKPTPIPPDDAFLAGLLHEVGTLYILMRSKDHEELWSRPDAFGAIINAWQARVGAKVVEQWEFPDELIAAVRDHDNCGLTCGVPLTLPEVVAVANYLADRSAAEEDYEAVIDNLPNLGSLNLERDALTWVLKAAEDEVSALESNMAGGKPPAAASR